MLDGTMPPGWVLELVLPGSRKTVSGPSDKADRRGERSTVAAADSPCCF